jgi:hypothetical protein
MVARQISSLDVQHDHRRGSRAESGWFRLQSRIPGSIARLSISQLGSREDPDSDSPDQMHDASLAAHGQPNL